MTTTRKTSALNVTFRKNGKIDVRKGCVRTTLAANGRHLAGPDLTIAEQIEVDAIIVEATARQERHPAADPLDGLLTRVGQR